jgi:hypothetical protein
MLAVIPVVAMLSGRCLLPPALPGRSLTPPTTLPLGARWVLAESAEPGREEEEFSRERPGAAGG